MTEKKAEKIFKKINSEIIKAQKEKAAEKRLIEKQKSPDYAAAIHRRTPRPVICVETGIVYPHAYSAAEKLGIERVNISQVCNPNSYKKHAGGFRWRYATAEESEQIRASAS